MHPLSYGINLDLDAGKTALHLASQHNKIEVVKALIKAGANVNALDDRGRNYLNYIREIDDIAIAFIEAGGEPNPNCEYKNTRVFLLKSLNIYDKKIASEPLIPFPELK